MQPILILCMVCSGCLFSVWPLVANRSGLDPWKVGVLFEFFALVAVMIFSVPNIRTFSAPKWHYVAIGGILAGLGVVFMSIAIGRAKPEYMARLFTISLIFEVIGAASYHFWLNGFNPQIAIGFLMAVGSVLLIK